MTMKNKYPSPIARMIYEDKVYKKGSVYACRGKKVHDCLGLLKLGEQLTPYNSCLCSLEAKGQVSKSRVPMINSIREATEVTLK